MFGLFCKKSKINKSNKNKYLYIWEGYCDVISERYEVEDLKEGFLNLMEKVPESLLSDFIQEGYRIKIIDSLDFVTGDIVSTKLDGQILYVLDSDIVNETNGLYNGFGLYLFETFRDTREINHLYNTIGVYKFGSPLYYFADLFGKYISGYYKEHPEKKDRDYNYIDGIVTEIRR